MRFNISVFVTLAIACAASAVDSSPSDSKTALDNAGIPKKFGFDFKPTGVIEVTFPQPPSPPSTNSTDHSPSCPSQSPPPPPSSSTDRDPPSPSQSPPPMPSNGLGCGGPIPGNDTTLSPTFKLRSSGKLSDLGSGPYIIVIVDPNAQSGDDPCTPKFVGTDFVFGDDGVSLKNNTPAVKDYQPKTGKGGESHNLTALLYKQPNGTFPNQIEPASDCTKFNISKFADNFGVGKDDAIAGTIVSVLPGNNQTN